MTLKQIKKFINECVYDCLINEGWYTSTSSPHFSKAETQHSLGNNPLAVDNGNHSSRDAITQPSTIDYNGEDLDAEPIYLSEKGMIIYKHNNFGNINIKETLSFFGSGAEAEKKFRNAIDTIYGAGKRNGKRPIFRTISPTALQRKRNSIRDSFWEFSFDNGNTWFILKPKPIENMKESKLKRKNNN